DVRGTAWVAGRKSVVFDNDGTIDLTAHAISKGGAVRSSTPAADATASILGIFQFAAGTDADAPINNSKTIDVRAIAFASADGGALAIASDVGLKQSAS